MKPTSYMTLMIKFQNVKIVIYMRLEVNSEKCEDGENDRERHSSI